MLPTKPTTCASAKQPTGAILIFGGTIVTFDPEHTIFEDGAVAVVGAHIAAVGPTSEVETAYPGAVRLDARGSIVLPGLINAHTHAPMSLLRGLADDLDLMDWLEHFVFPTEAAHVSEEFVRWGTRLACLEMLRSGTTTFVDAYYFEDAIAEEMEACGIRAVLGQTLIDPPAPDYKTWNRAIKYTHHFVERWREHARISPAVAPHASYSLSQERLVEAGQLAEELDVPLLMHVAEDRREVRRVTGRTGKTPIALLEHLGILGPRLLAAHVVWPTQGELALLAARGVSVVHCPQSNMKLAAGVAPIPAMLAAGVTVGIGTDGAGSNNDLNIWEEVDTTAKLHKLMSRDPTILPAKQALALATIDGARALGMAEQIGSIEIGKRADIITVSTNGFHQLPQDPAENPYSFLVYSTKASDVQTVVVDGKILLKNGRMLHLDVAEIAREAYSLRKGLDGVPSRRR